MSIFELFLVAVGLSMDAFAVSICKGLALRRATLKSMALAGPDACGRVPAGSSV